MNLHDFVLEGSIAEDIAIIDGQDNQWTYGRLRSLIAHLSGYLENASNPQDRCLICSDNGVFWLCAFLACARAGRIAVPVAPDRPYGSVEQILAQCAPRIAFVDAARCDRIRMQTSESTLVVCDEEADGSSILSWTDTTAFLPSENSYIPGEGNIAAIMYTSGASAEPRGAILSHQNLTASIRATAEHLRFASTDRTLCAVGLFSTVCLTSCLAQLRAGGTLVVDRILPGIDPSRVLTQLIRHSTTGMIARSDTLQALLDRSGFDSATLPSLRFIEHVGGRAPYGMVASLQQLFPHAAIHSMYGLAEAGGAVAAVPHELAVTKASAVGEPLPGVTLSVVDPYDHPTPPGETGEIIVSSPSIARGYWGESEHSQKVFHRGHLHTGDLGYFDDDGQLHLAGRTSDYLRLGGVPVNTSQIEMVAAQFPGLREAAILTRHDAILGDVVVLVAVHPRGDEVRQQLMEFCANRLPFSQRPHEIHFRSHLPRKSDGQIDRLSLIEEIGLEQHVLRPLNDQLQAPGQPMQG